MPCCCIRWCCSAPSGGLGCLESDSFRSPPVSHSCSRLSTPPSPLAHAPHRHAPLYFLPLGVLALFWQLAVLIFNFYYFMSVDALPVHVSGVRLVSGVLGGKRGNWIPWNLSYRLLWAVTRALGIEPWSFRRAASTAPLLCFELSVFSVVWPLAYFHLSFWLFCVFFLTQICTWILLVFLPPFFLEYIYFKHSFNWCLKRIFY